VVSGVRRMNEVNARRARLVGWVGIPSRCFISQLVLGQKNKIIFQDVWISNTRMSYSNTADVGRVWASCARGDTFNRFADFML